MRLYASSRYALLLIFQAMDAAGKDGVIKARCLDLTVFTQRRTGLRVEPRNLIGAGGIETPPSSARKRRREIA
jgi:hypothetical protein